MTVAGGVQDQSAVALSRGKLDSSSQVLPTVCIEGNTQTSFMPLVLTPPPDPSLPKTVYVFTKDLGRLIADLEVTDDEATVIQRYRDALAAKGEVRCNFRSHFYSVAPTYPEVWAGIRYPR